jgi:hypothetical protein
MMEKEIKKLLEEYSSLLGNIAEEDVKEAVRLLKDSKKQAANMLIEQVMCNISEDSFLKLKEDHATYLKKRAEISEKSKEFVDKLFEIAKAKAIELLFTV